MKKLLILTAVALLTASAAGCQCGPFGNFCRRDALLGSSVVSDCEPACNSCEGPVLGEGYLPPPTIMPGPIVQ